MDGRQRVGRLRLRPLDWVVGGARPHWGRRTSISPPILAGTKSFKEWLSSFWTPALRVLEVCDGGPILAADARSHRALEYFCLTPPEISPKCEEVGRLGWTCLRGEPIALARCRLKFDLIAWLREETSLSAIFNAADLLLQPNGLLAATTKKRIDARRGVRWQVQEAIWLAEGTMGLAASRRSHSKAA